MAKLLKEPGGVAAQVEAMARPVMEELGLSLWDVRFEKEGADWYLKVLIDRPLPQSGEGASDAAPCYAGAQVPWPFAPLDTDLCEQASRALDPLLDEADPISQSYVLEVGSPGLGRMLTRRAHFDAMQGQKLAVRLYAADASGRKELSGYLQALQADTLTLAAPDGPVSLSLAAISSVRACDDEDLFG